jgi:penicillin amidase
MKITPFLISTAVTAGLVFALNKKWGSIPPVGKFLSPQFGIWQNAEPAGESYDGEFTLPGLKDKTEVFFDERLVPHIFAQNDGDACLVQGYLHAKFRLWQMEFQTHAAAGRVSEIVGAKAINYDKTKRRLGMVYAAESMLREVEANPLTKTAVDNYTAGVNAYISSLKESQLPIEYKLLDYKPEKWTNLKTALFIKQMTETLAGFVDDLPMTHAKGIFSDQQLKVLFPQVADSLDPIVPKGTVFAKPAVIPVKPASADSLYLNKKETSQLADLFRPDPDNGSNNWAVAGSKTKSGSPILCNDPHLELSFPSIWYEMQMSTPSMNAYGVSFPGIPGIVIGFNDSIAFGFTNSQRDVRDYYEIQFKDDSKKQYWFKNEWKDATIRVDTIRIKGKEPVYDTIAYTVFGPVMYDKSFPADNAGEKNLAVRWAAHDPSNELLMWYYLDRAKNYNDYYNAIQYFTCPAQNMVFASKAGDIAIWQQGRMPALWDRQGIYIMPGFDSSYMWQGYIPREENPHLINPPRGFVSSANQRPVDSTYPYFIPGNYDLYRGYTINKKLSAMNGITPQDMMSLHGNNHNSFAEMMRPVLLKYVDETKLSNAEKKWIDILKNWNLKNDYGEKGATVYQSWFDSLEAIIWKDELEKADVKGILPSERTLVEALLRDSSFVYIDDINTVQRETAADIITAALKKAGPALLEEEKQGKLEWGKHKNTTVYHLLRDAVMPFAKTGLPIGGGTHIINAAQHSHGPSWRMIVHLTEKTEAYGVYPGGQSGNPGSKYYDSFTDQWAQGKYYPLWFMRAGDKTDKKVKWKMTFDKI